MENIFTTDETAALTAMLKELTKEMAENPITPEGEIQYPLEIDGVDIKISVVQQNIGPSVGTLVKIRPCSNDPNDRKTHLGIYLGNLIADVLCAYRPKTKRMEILSRNNPAIFVPALNRIVWGMESWWGVIKNESELSDITDEDIDKVWYVQLLKSRFNNNNQE